MNVRVPNLTLASPENGTSYRITLVPPDPATAPPPWRTIYVLDADDHLDVALDACRGLWARGGDRSLLLVGIGYGARFKQPGNRRIRDLTPRPVDDEPESGGAEAFHQFLTTTLWERLETLYPVTREDVTLMGHSLGGLFVLHALFRARRFFRRGLAAAPSVWWDDRAIFDRIAAHREVDGELPARLFIALGESDTESMRAAMADLERQLVERPFEGLRLSFRHFPGRGHFNVIPAAYLAGIRALFE